MKYILLSGMLLSLTFSSFAQKEIAVGLTLPVLANKSSNIDVISSFGGIVSYGQYIKLGKNFRLYPSINLVGNRFVTDGHFSKNNNGEFEFQSVPNDYKISSLTMYEVNIPVLLKYKFIGDDKKGAGYIGAGPYVGYVLFAKQTYKVNNDNYIEDAPIQNKLNYGISAELSLSTKMKTGDLLMMNAGLQYQVSNYLANSQSFNPIQLYCKVGIGF